MKTNRFSSESIVATMASFVGICALLVSIMQTHYQRKYLLASAWPHLQTAIYRTEKKDSTKNIVTIKLMNKGIGPAIIESVAYEYEGKPIAGLDPLVKKIVGLEFSGSYKDFVRGEAIAQNEDFDYVSISGAKASRVFREALGKIKIKIIYKSVHDEHWEYLFDLTIEDGSKTTKLD